jgi:hypothetical protein
MQDQQLRLLRLFPTAVDYLRGFLHDHHRGLHASAGL